MGIAISTPGQEFVFAHPQIANSKEQIAIEKIVEIINSEKIVGIVVGLPLRLDGTESKTTAMVREFADALAGQIALPIILIDESLTSAEAEEGMKDEGRGMKNLDSESARIILENAISVIRRKIE